MRPLPWVRTALAAACVFFSPVFETVAAQTAPAVVVSELRFRGASSSDEFIELFNAGSGDVDISGWTVVGSDMALPHATIPDGTVIKPGCYYLLTGTGYRETTAPDFAYGLNFPDAVGMAIRTTDGAVADAVGFNGAPIGEGERLPVGFSQVGASFERKPGGVLGHADTDDNRTDFQEIFPSTPSNSQSTCLAVQTIFTPHDVQGPGATSPKAGNALTVRGVLTARTSAGFFIQSESSREDLDPATSEGLFVAAPSTLDPGAVVQVKGTVQEFADGLATVTRLHNVTDVTVLGNVPELPEPVVLTGADLSASGPADQLERFEGMRVRASLMSVSGAGLDGSFFAVLGGARPFREPGIEAGAPALPCAASPCNFTTFDGNPERVRVDAAAITGTAARISSLAGLGEVTGPLHYALNAYTVLPEQPLSPGGIEVSMLPPAPDGHYSVGSLNLGDADVPVETRLAKASQIVHGVLSEPDVLAVQNADLLQLGELAARLGGYTAVDGRFLVKSDRVTVVSTDVIGDSTLFERPSLMMRVIVNGGALVLPQHLTVIANELRSLADVGRSDAAGQAARAQRQAQAEAIAEAIRDRQLNNPNEAIVSLGNYNAFEFNDGYVDVVGTIAGTPAPGDQVVLASPDRVPQDLENLIGTLPAAQRYSSVADGNAQSLDHVLISPQLVGQFAGFGFARVNADFPEALQADAASPERLSDRDPAVAYFMFPPDVSAPVFDLLPQDLAAEATGPEGAAVHYDVPTATDNLDGAVAVSCAPLSGSVFPLGYSGVLCSTTDAAGNLASVDFTVAVRDTTAPLLLVPSGITDAADSPAGRIVNYSVSASDAVTAVPAITCSPASGSMFGLGTTTVNCQASDDAGNSSAADFTVTIGVPVLGRMHGAGQISSGGQRVTFMFEARESANYVERGRLMLVLKEQGRPGRLVSASVSDVRLSNVDDSVTFSAYGAWNGQTGHRFDVTARDYGEPGAGVDTLQVTVTSPNGEVVETLSGVLTTGDIHGR